MTPGINLSEAERAAVILMLLDDDEAVTVLSRLEPEELQLVGRTMLGMEDVGPDRIASAIAGFIQHADTGELPTRDRQARMHTMMTRAVGHVKADSLMQQIAPDQRAPTVELARWLAPEVLAPLIADEHPQAIAVLLLLLDPEMAAQVLAALPEEIQPALVERIARLGPVSAHAVDMLDAMLTDRLSRRFGKAALTMGGAREAAGLINQAAGAVEAVVMPAIAARDAGLAAAIEAEMFKFDLILALTPKDMGRLLRDIESEILIDALKGLAEDDREVFFKAMSERAADGVRDEIETRGRVKKSAVESAQQTIIDQARKLAEEGEVELANGGGSSEDSDYV